MQLFFWQLVARQRKKADAPTTFSYVYAIDPSTLDYSVTSKSSTSDVIANLVDDSWKMTNTET